MSMLEPLKMIMVEYCPLLDVMQQDSNTKKSGKGKEFLHD
jgi:hypothetical protein